MRGRLQGLAVDTFWGPALVSPLMPLARTLYCVIHTTQAHIGLNCRQVRSPFDASALRMSRR